MCFPRAWSIWCVAATFYLYEFIQRVAPAVMIPELMQSFQVSAATLGSLSAFYYYALAFCQIPAGICVDRYSIRVSLSLAACVTVLGSYSFCSTHSLIGAMFARSLVGAGSAFAFIGCLTLASRWIDKRNFPFMVGLTNLCGVFGAILGGSPLSLAVEQLGWQRSLLYLTGIGVLLLFLLWKVIRDYPTDMPVRPLAQLRLSHYVQTVLRNKHTWWIALYGCLLVTPIATLPELWSVPFLMEAHELDRPSAAFASSMIFIGIACGGPTFGFIASRLRHYQPLLKGGSLIALFLLIIILYSPPMPSLLLYVCLWGFGAATSNMLLCFSLVAEHHPPEVRGIAIGFTNMVIMIGGAIFQPLVGRLLDYHSHGTLIDGVPIFQAHDYRNAFSVLPVCLIIALFVQFKLKRGPF